MPEVLNPLELELQLIALPTVSDRSLVQVLRKSSKYP